MGIRLSRDALKVTLEHLEVADLLNVSLVCRAFKGAADPLIYSAVCLSWSDIDAIALSGENDDFDARLAFVRKACIEADGRGEWKSSPDLHWLQVASDGQLRDLHITCELRSSGWFKYITPALDNVKTLELGNCGSCQNFSFDFAHIANSLPNLESISLGDHQGGFIVDPCPDGGLRHLRHIRVVNCEWHYPTKLVEAASNSVLESLDISYDREMHPFAFSERLRTEFTSLPMSLTSLRVHIDVGQTIKWNPLQRSRPMPNLQEVDLSGFEFEYKPSKNALSNFPKLKKLVQVHYSAQ